MMGEKKKGEKGWGVACFLGGGEKKKKNSGNIPG